MKPICLILRALAVVTTLFILYSPTAHAAQNAAKIAGDLTLNKDSNGNNTGIHFSDGTSQFTGNPWGTANSTSPDIGFVQGKVGIGTLTPATALDVNGDINLSGNLLLPATTATSGIIRQGANTLLHTYGNDNFFIGIGAGNLSTTGAANTALGNWSLSSISTGQSNTAIGRYTLNKNTSGNYNTANGGEALNSNTNGSSNTAIGNTSLLMNTSGALNTAIGRSSLEDNTTGDGNTAVGFRAGYPFSPGVGNTTGSNNTFIGRNSGPGTSAEITNATAIGYNALVSQSNSMVLGGTGTDAVKVGIGTTTPGATLDALRLIRVLGSTLTAGDWPTSGIGLELAHDSVSNKGYIVSYNRTTPAWGSLDIQASTVTIGGIPGNLSVPGTINAGNIASGTWNGTAISPVKGGTGLDSSGTVTGSILKTTSTGIWSTLAPGSEGQTLKMSGGSPVWSSSGVDATGLFRVLGTTPITWPSSGKGIEIAHNSTTNTGYIQSYDRGGSQWSPLEINASTVTVGGSGSPGNLAVTGTLTSTNVRIKPGLGERGVPFTNGMIMKAVGANNPQAEAPPIGTAVARTDLLILERDGSNGGWRINYPVVESGKELSITCTGININSTFVGFINNSLPVGTTQVFTDGAGVQQFTCMFGNVYNAGEITQITLHRKGTDYYWQGFMNSTYDQ